MTGVSAGWRRVLENEHQQRAGSQQKARKEELVVERSHCEAMVAALQEASRLNLIVETRGIPGGIIGGNWDCKTGVFVHNNGQIEKLSDDAREATTRRNAERNTNKRCRNTKYNHHDEI